MTIDFAGILDRELACDKFVKDENSSYLLCGKSDCEEFSTCVISAGMKEEWDSGY